MEEPNRDPEGIPLFPPLAAEDVSSKTLTDDQKRHIFAVSRGRGDDSRAFNWVEPESVAEDIHMDDRNLLGAYQAVILWQHVFAYSFATGNAPDPRMMMMWTTEGGGTSPLSEAVAEIEYWAENAHDKLSASLIPRSKILRLMALLVVEEWSEEDIVVPHNSDVEEFFEQFFELVSTRIDQYVDLIQIEYNTLLLLQSAEAKEIATARSMAEASLRSGGTIRAPPVIKRQKRRRIGKAMLDGSGSPVLAEVLETTKKMATFSAQYV